MAKGSVRKKGKKWYYRFYVEDASGNLVQKEYAGTEKLLRQAMDDYESKKFIAKTDNLTVGELLDMWVEEELKVGTLSIACRSVAKRLDGFERELSGHSDVSTTMNVNPLAFNFPIILNLLENPHSH